jgi:hypothetical protein
MLYYTSSEGAMIRPLVFPQTMRTGAHTKIIRRPRRNTKKWRSPHHGQFETISHLPLPGGGRQKISALFFVRNGRVTKIYDVALGRYRAKHYAKGLRVKTTSQ